MSPSQSEEMRAVLEKARGGAEDAAAAEGRGNRARASDERFARDLADKARSPKEEANIGKTASGEPKAAGPEVKPPGGFGKRAAAAD